MIFSIFWCFQEPCLLIIDSPVFLAKECPGWLQNMMTEDLARVLTDENELPCLIVEAGCYGI